MSDKDPPNPFEEIKKQIGKLFKNSSVTIHAIEDDSDHFEDDEVEEEDNGTA